MLFTTEKDFETKMKRVTYLLQQHHLHTGIKYAIYNGYVFYSPVDPKWSAVAISFQRE